MSFILYLIIGLASGIIGGMGMGGGTILIPALSIFMGVNQRVAQATNVISFLPMAALALPAHKKNGLLKTDGVWYIIVPALISTLLFSLVMSVLPADFLKKLFGLFLIALALKQSFNTLQTVRSKQG